METITLVCHSTGTVPNLYMKLEICGNQETSAMSKSYSPPLSCHQEASWLTQWTLAEIWAKVFLQSSVCSFNCYTGFPVCFSNFSPWLNTACAKPCNPLLSCQAVCQNLLRTPKYLSPWPPKIPPSPVYSIFLSNCQSCGPSDLTCRLLHQKPTFSFFSLMVYLTACAFQLFKKHKWPSDHRFWQSPLQWNPWTQLTQIPCP